MALITMRTKIARLLCSVTHKTAFGNFSNNGVIRHRNWGDPIGGFGSFSSSAASLDNSEASGSSRLVGWKGYEEYRRALYGGNITHKALLVDAVGTLVIPSQPMAQVSFFLVLLLRLLLSLSAILYFVDFNHSLIYLYSNSWYFGCKCAILNYPFHISRYSQITTISFVSLYCDCVVSLLSPLSLCVIYIG